MSLWRRLTHGVRTLANRSAADQDITDEVQHYLEQATAAYVARGLPRDEAVPYSGGWARLPRARPS